MPSDLVWSAVNVSALKTEEWFQHYLNESVDETVYMLAESDALYGRSVVTYVGPIRTVMDHIYALVQAATTHVDMNQHQGLHYRMGAVDVIPFVPLHDTFDPLEMIHSWAQRIGELMPVIMYEKSALSPSNRSLKKIRKGGFEALKNRFLIGENPCDFGDIKKGLKSGCTAIGVRDPLLAYNLEFESNDVVSLRKVAQRIRASGGGYPGLDATVFSLSESWHHLSMNLRRFDLYSIESITHDILKQCDPNVHIFIQSEVIGLLSRSMSASQEPDLMRWMQTLNASLKISNLRAEKVLESVVSHL